MGNIATEKKAILALLEKYTPQLWPTLTSDLTLAEHSKSLYDFETSKTHTTRQKLVQQKVAEKLVRLYGKDYNQDLQLDLDNQRAISIVDHHQVINHPYLTSTNIISSVDKFLRPTKQSAILVFSSSDIPPNNCFSQNGFQFHGKRVPIFSNSERELISYYIPKRDFNFVERLQNSNRWSEFDQAEQKFLEAEQAKLSSFDYSRCTDYADQISVVIKNTWPYLFEEKLRDTLPELVCITQEEIVSQCLIEILKEDNFISQCLFDRNLRDRAIQNFNGFGVAWDQARNKGTHFFWRKYPDQNRTLRMYVDGDKLVPADDRFKDQAVPLNPETIINLLQKKEIYPNLFLIFTALNFYCGIKPLAGYGSIVYLDLLKKAWLKTLADSDFKAEKELVDSVATDGFIAGFSLFFERLPKSLRALYASDIFFNGGVSEESLRKVFSMKFRDLASVAIPDMYAYASSRYSNYIPEAKRMKVTISQNDLAEEVFSWVK